MGATKDKPLSYKAISGVSRPSGGSQFVAKDVGDVGVFGMKDVEYLRKQGLSDDEIRWHASKNELNVGPKAAAEIRIAGKLDGSSSPSSLFKYTDPGDKGSFGLRDIEELEKQGVDKATMSYIASGQKNIGPIAKRILGLDKEDQWKRDVQKVQRGGTEHTVLKPDEIAARSFGSQGIWKPDTVYTSKEDYQEMLKGANKQPNKHLYTDPGDKGVFGMKDLEELKKQGMARDQLKYFASRQSKVGPRAAKELGLTGSLYPEGYSPKEKSESFGSGYTYTDPGDKNAFGMKDVEELSKQGVSDKQMRFIAAGQKTIGEKAAKYLGINPK